MHSHLYLPAATPREMIFKNLFNFILSFLNPKTNISLSWTKMESDAFWRLFKDYENAGGDGYMHTPVRPAMMNLTVIDI